MQTGAQVELDPSRYQGSPKDLLTAAELAATGMILFPEPISTAAGTVLRGGTTAARLGPAAYRAAKSFGPRVVGQAKTAIKELPEDILTALGRRISGGKLPTSGTSPGLPIPPRYRPSSSSFADIGRQAIANLKLGKRGAGLGILGLIEGIRRGGGERPQPQPEPSRDVASAEDTLMFIQSLGGTPENQLSHGGIVKMETLGQVPSGTELYDEQTFDAQVFRNLYDELGIEISPELANKVTLTEDEATRYGLVIKQAQSQPPIQAQPSGGLNLISTVQADEVGQVNPSVNRVPMLDLLGGYEALTDESQALTGGPQQVSVSEVPGSDTAELEQLRAQLAVLQGAEGAGGAGEVEGGSRSVNYGSLLAELDAQKFQPTAQPYGDVSEAIRKLGERETAESRKMEWPVALAAIGRGIAKGDAAEGFATAVEGVAGSRAAERQAGRELEQAAALLDIKGMEATSQAEQVAYQMGTKRLVDSAQVLRYEDLVRERGTQNAQIIFNYVGPLVKSMVADPSFGLLTAEQKLAKMKELTESLIQMVTSQFPTLASTGSTGEPKPSAAQIAATLGPDIAAVTEEGTGTGTGPRVTETGITITPAQ